MDRSQTCSDPRLFATPVARCSDSLLALARSLALPSSPSRARALSLSRSHSLSLPPPPPSLSSRILSHTCSLHRPHSAKVSKSETLSLRSAPRSQHPTTAPPTAPPASSVTPASWRETLTLGGPKDPPALPTGVCREEEGGYCREEAQGWGVGGA